VPISTSEWVNLVTQAALLRISGRSACLPGAAAQYTPRVRPQEERPDPLRDALEAAEEQAAVNEPGAIKAFREILGDQRLDEEALKVKELAIYR
jgi:hypothetical protein